MATLFLICGLPGSGKTTLAQQLEKKHAALRLSPDEWISPLLNGASDRAAELDRLRTPVEAVQWAVAQRVLTLGLDVILENGFWAKDERLTYRLQAAALGARVEFYFLDVDLAELWQRLSKRNTNLPADTFVVTQEDLTLWDSWFQRPTVAELKLYDAGFRITYP